MTTTSLTGTWYGSPGNFLNIGDTLATFYIDKGTLPGSTFPGFTGAIGDSAFFGNVSFGILIPEPSTVVLLGIGAVSLLAYAWRRRCV